MNTEGFDKKYAQTHNTRFQKTLAFCDGIMSTNDKILDIGPINPFSKMLIEKGFDVANTEMIDLDLDYSIVEKDNFDVVTAFEIFEHLVSPFPLIKNIKADKLIASVPLKLWFSNAYWNDNDPYDCHYHEFEPKQFDLLLNKAGWEIIKSEKWISKPKSFGLRPILRYFTPRYYIVYCERKQNK